VIAQRLDRVLTAYRIGDPDGAYPIFDGTGSQLFPGRWNTAASPMIYTSEHYSTAVLEKFVYGSGHMPPNQHFIEITIPSGVTYKTLDPAHLPGWADALAVEAKAYGEAWQAAQGSLLLIVPSVVSDGAQYSDQPGASGISPGLARFAPAGLVGQTAVRAGWVDYSAACATTSVFRIGPCRLRACVTWLPKWT
jgi:RES domain-containing protein